MDIGSLKKGNDSYGPGPGFLDFLDSLDIGRPGFLDFLDSLDIGRPGFFGFSGFSGY
jgi:hypothetical protein